MGFFSPQFSFLSPACFVCGYFFFLALTADEGSHLTVERPHFSKRRRGRAARARAATARRGGSMPTTVGARVVWVLAPGADGSALPQ
jgi:hypothetical protein